MIRRLHTRERDAGEPPTSAPIYVRFGMTKGALVAVLVLTLGAIAGFVRLETLAAHSRATDRRVAVVVAKQAATLRQVEQTQRENRAAVREVCRQSEFVASLASASEELFRRLIGSKVISPKLAPAYKGALLTFEAYTRFLSERPACRRVSNP